MSSAPINSTSKRQASGIKGSVWISKWSSDIPEFSCLYDPLGDYCIWLFSNDVCDKVSAGKPVCECYHVLSGQHYCHFLCNCSIWKTWPIKVLLLRSITFFGWMSYAIDDWRIRLSNHSCTLSFHLQIRPNLYLHHQLLVCRTTISYSF